MVAKAISTVELGYSVSNCSKKQSYRIFITSNLQLDRSLNLIIVVWSYMGMTNRRKESHMATTDVTMKFLRTDIAIVIIL